MILTKRIVHSLLLVLAIVCILFRYPIDVGHELGSDTTFVHALTDSIVQNGRGPWILQPLSYFGLYGLSYPSAMPFFFASASLLGNTPIEAVTLVSGWAAAVSGMLGAFLLARRIRRDDTFALLVAAVFSLAPFLVKDTFWVASTRGFVVALLPVFVLLLVRFLVHRIVRDIALALLLFVLLAAIHRMGTLALFFLVAFVFAIPFHKLTQRLRFALVRYEQPVRYIILGSAVGGFFGVFYLQFLYPGAAGANVFDQYGSGAFFHGETFPILVANMGISLSGKIGPLFPLALFGLTTYIWRRPKEVVDKFLLTSAIVFLPMLSLRDYMGEFLILLFVILVCVGVAWLRARARRRRFLQVALVIVIVGSLAFSWEMKDYWRERYGTDASISLASYQASLYVRYSTSGTVVANEGLFGGRIAAISGRAIMPLGGASLHWNSPQQLAWGFVAPDDVHVHLLPVTSISFDTDEIFVPQGLRNAEFDWEAMLSYAQPNLAENLFQLYGVHYIVVNKDFPNTFYSYGYERPSHYLAFDLPSNYYTTYDDGASRIWYRG